MAFAKSAARARRLHRGKRELVYPRNAVKIERHSNKWGCSSAGRAPRSQRGGHRFDPGQLHQTAKISSQEPSYRFAVISLSAARNDCADPGGGTWPPRIVWSVAFGPYRSRMVWSSVLILDPSRLAPA